MIYECDCIYTQLADALKSKAVHTKQVFFLLLIEKWMAQEVLIETLVENSLTGILYDTHMKNRNFMKTIFLKDSAFSEREADYMVSLLANIIPADMNIRYQHGKTDRLWRFTAQWDKA